MVVETMKGVAGWVIGMKMKGGMGNLLHVMLCVRERRQHRTGANVCINGREKMSIERETRDLM